MIEIDLPMALRMELVPGTTDTAAVMYGPIVLAVFNDADSSGLGVGDGRNPDPNGSPGGFVFPSFTPGPLRSVAGALARQA